MTGQKGATRGVRGRKALRGWKAGARRTSRGQGRREARLAAMRPPIEWPTRWTLS